MPTDPAQAARSRAFRALICCAYVATAAVALRAADSVAQLLFNRIHDGVADNIRNFPRYTCVQTVTRRTFQLPPAGSSCASVVANDERNTAERILRWHDRLRLDVAVGDKSEMFSWAGATEFETGDIAQMVARGASGSGEFGSFLASVFGGDAEDFVYRGLKETPLGRLATFDFTVRLRRATTSTARAKKATQPSATTVHSMPTPIPPI